ncbi:MAG TPA: aminotransferase class V-fold PLP-dependent enzyme [Bacteroidota bacterium]|nr:aminotransferase class V-fold PLP-dependent enzyme [Bacteroidota bacterium]
MNENTVRRAPLDMSAAEFRDAGHALVERIAGLLDWLHDRSNPVTRAEGPAAIRRLLGSGSLPRGGEDAGKLLDASATLLFEHSLFNGHPRFWGYITSPAAPIGILGDFLASAVNPNVGAYDLSPVATEIERLTVRWIAELIGYPATCGGILVSGGNMANFVCFLAARKAKVPWDVRVAGGADPRSALLRIYCSSETHTWINKAVELFGLGQASLRKIPAGEDQRMSAGDLRAAIDEDLKNGLIPLMVVGAAGTVSTGAIDPLAAIAETCREHNLWFHADGAYGGFAACLPEASADLKAIALADSVAVDPHKWLYAPLEAGCALVRSGQALIDAFSHHPEYYRFDEHADEGAINFYEMGLQNSRGFRALKVWLALRQAGRDGYETMIRDDCALAATLFKSLERWPEIEPLASNLSIAAFRYAPARLRAKPGDEYLNTLNTEILARLQAGGRVYPSNALVSGKYAIRACIVNFRTTREDLLVLPDLVVKTGKEVEREMPPR